MGKSQKKRFDGTLSMTSGEASVAGVKSRIPSVNGTDICPIKARHIAHHWTIIYHEYGAVAYYCWGVSDKEGSSYGERKPKDPQVRS